MDDVAQTQAEQECVGRGGQKNAVESGQKSTGK